MALFDWNKNGKDDLFDTMMDYALYKETFGKDESEDVYDNSSIFGVNDSEEIDFDEWNDDQYVAQSVDSGVDTTLCFADKGLSEEQLLRRLVNLQNRIYKDCEELAVVSGFREEVTESQQLHKDIWLYSFAKQLEYSTLSKDNKCALLQMLLDTFSIDNPMSAEEYYREILVNSQFFAYVNNCLDTKPERCGMFWVLLTEMGGNASERTIGTKNPVELLRDYIVFMEDLETYLQKMFEGAGFGGHMHQYMTMVAESVAYAINNIDTVIETYTEDTENPLYQ